MKGALKKGGWAWALAGIFLFLQIPLLTWLDSTNVSRFKARSNPFSRKVDVPPEYLASYLSSNLFGGFKQIAIDYLWIKYNRLKKEKRFEEAVALLEALRILQPNRERVWDHLGWDITFNLSKRAPTREEEWKVIDRGIRSLKKGMKQMPDSYRIPLQLAQVYYKRIPQEHLFMEKVWNRKRKNGRRMTCYGVAVEYLKQGREIAIEKERLPFYRTRYGLMVTYMFYDLVRLLHRHRFKQVLRKTKKVEAYTLELIQDRGGMEHANKPYTHRYKSYRMMPELVEQEKKISEIPWNSPAQKKQNRDRMISAIRGLMETYRKFFHRYPIGRGTEAGKHLLTELFNLLYYVDADLGQYYKTGKQRYKQSALSLFRDTIRPLLKNVTIRKFNTSGGYVERGLSELTRMWDVLQEYYQKTRSIYSIKYRLNNQSPDEETRTKLLEELEKLERQLEETYVKLLTLYNSNHWAFRKPWFRKKIEYLEKELNIHG